MNSLRETNDWHRARLHERGVEHNSSAVCRHDDQASEISIALGPMYDFTYLRLRNTVWLSGRSRKISKSYWQAECRIGRHDISDVRFRHAALTQRDPVVFQQTVALSGSH